MTDIRAEFDYRRSLLSNLNYDEASIRLSGFLQWLELEDVTRSILQNLQSTVDVSTILETAGNRNPPKASTAEEIAAIGVFIMMECRKGVDIVDIGDKYGIEPPFSTSSIQDHLNEIVHRYINPAIDFIERKLVQQTKAKVITQYDPYDVGVRIKPPLEITESLERFIRDNSDYQRNAFIMMKFGVTKAHQAIVESVRYVLNRYGIKALRADDKQYHDDLFPNVLTYIYGCNFGIAIFERLEEEDFNPNVSFEVGYMKALHKPVCLLKDKTLKTLHTDLVGKLYKSFDPQSPDNTIPQELENWLRDKEIITL